MSAEPYDTIAEAAEDVFIEKKSRFIGAACPAQTEAEARAFLAERREKFYDASHNCFAFTLRDGGILRYSDDGEPQGTAGTPILEVVRREGLWNIVVVVTRYFGGTLLGAGGLIRAYSHTAKLAIDAARRVTMCPCTLLMLSCPYHLYEQMQLLLAGHGVVVLDTDFGADITFQLRIKSEGVVPLRKACIELSNGGVEPIVMGTEFSAI